MLPDKNTYNQHNCRDSPYRDKGHRKLRVHGQGRKINTTNKAAFSLLSRGMALLCWQGRPSQAGSGERTRAHHSHMNPIPNVANPLTLVHDTRLLAVTERKKI